MRVPSIWRGCRYRSLSQGQTSVWLGLWRARDNIAHLPLSNRTSSSNKILFWKQPPVSATVSSEKSVVSVARTRNHFANRFRESVMEPACHPRNRGLSGKIFQQTLPHRRRIKIEQFAGGLPR